MKIQKEELQKLIKESIEEVEQNFQYDPLAMSIINLIEGINGLKIPQEDIIKTAVAFKNKEPQDYENLDNILRLFIKYLGISS